MWEVRDRDIWCRARRWDRDVSIAQEVAWCGVSDTHQYVRYRLEIVPSALFDT